MQAGESPSFATHTELLPIFESFDFDLVEAFRILDELAQRKFAPVRLATIGTIKIYIYNSWVDNAYEVRIDRTVDNTEKLMSHKIYTSAKRALIAALRAKEHPLEILV